MDVSNEDDRIELVAAGIVPLLAVLLALGLAFGHPLMTLLRGDTTELAVDISAIDFDAPFDEEPVSTQILEHDLVVQDFKEGEGATVVAGDTVSIHYTGYLLDGTVFDSSVQRNQPITIPVGMGRVIPGWDMGVPGLRPGGKRRLIIPPELAYGDRARGKIPADATLVFTLELIEIR